MVCKNFLSTRTWGVSGKEGGQYNPEGGSGAGGGSSGGGWRVRRDKSVRTLCQTIHIRKLTHKKTETTQSLVSVFWLVAPHPKALLVYLRQENTPKVQKARSSLLPASKAQATGHENKKLINTLFLL